MQPTAALLKQVGSCHLQRTVAPPDMAFYDICDRGCLQQVLFYKKCSQCLPPQPHSMETQCLGEGQLQVNMHKGTATTFIVGEVSSKLKL